MPGIKFVLCAVLAIHLASCFVQFQIIRNPHQSKKLALSKSQCQDPATISSQVKYSQACYDKDIAYVMQFDHLNKKKYLSLDFTSPISWIKDEKCKTLDNNKSCTLLQQSFNQKVKGIFKQKITAMIQKLKKQIEDDDSKAIIQGSNEVVMGDVDQVKNLSIIGKNHDHFNNLIDVFLLGLYVIGEYDSIVLNTTTFIKAHKITPNLNSICDGAISLRLDESSQASFLNQVFEYMKSAQKDRIISIYLGKDKKVVTIGGLSPKYAQNGLSSFTKVKLQDSDDGRLPHIQGLIFQSDGQENTIEADNQLIFTLSSSYIGFTKNITQQMLKNFFPSTLKCKINSEFYIQCSNEDEEDVQIVKSASLDVDLDTSMIHFEMKDLIKSQEKSKIVFNIKQIQCGNTIMGEPFFLKYYTYFDYHKNQVAFAPRKLTLEESFMTALTLIHFVILTLLLGCCFLITSNPCKKIYYHFFQKIAYKTQQSVKKTIRSYQPIFEDQDDKQQPKGNAQKLQEDVQGI